MQPPSPSPDHDKYHTLIFSGSNDSQSSRTMTSSVSDLSHPCPSPSLMTDRVHHQSAVSRCPTTQSSAYESPGTTSISKWGPGRNHRELSQEGYRALAICATFLAGMQGQVMSFTATTPAGKPIPVVSAIFLLGLFADVFGAILSFSTARWLEMLTENEADFLQWCWDVESGDKKKKSDNPPASRVSHVSDRWVCVSLSAGPYVVALGLICLILGLLVYTWASQCLAVLVLACVLCAGCMAFVMAFVLRHNRMNVLARFHLKRRSG